MSLAKRLTEQERAQIETLILALDNHGCGMGLDVQAQAALTRLLEALDEAERAAAKYRATVDEQGSPAH